MFYSLTEGAYLSRVIIERNVDTIVHPPSCSENKVSAFRGNDGLTLRENSKLPVRIRGTARVGAAEACREALIKFCFRPGMRWYLLLVHAMKVPDCSSLAHSSSCSMF